MTKITNETEVSCGCGWSGTHGQLKGRMRDTIWGGMRLPDVCPDCKCDHQLTYEVKDD